MSVLLEHVTAVTMDEERWILKDAYVAVEGTKIAFTFGGRSTSWMGRLGQRY